jgi:monoterpene epsilon-lactone hydrolase
MQLPIFKTTGEILEYCWAYRARVVLYGSIPLTITVVLNLGAWLSGTDLMNPQNPVVAGLSIISAIVFLPFTVTWYRAIILGDEDLHSRPLFTLGGLEGQMLVWQLIIGLIVIGVGLLGALAISGVLRALSAALGPAAELLSAVALGLWGIYVISMLCRLSLVLAMVATGRPAVMREAWEKSQGLGTRMAAIFVLCVLSIIVLLIPAQFIVVTAASIVGIIAESAAEPISMILQILLGSFASLLIYVLPATLFAFVYTRIAAAMVGAGSAMDASLDSGPPPMETSSPDSALNQQQHANTEDEVNAVLERLGAYMADKPKESAEDMRALIDGLFSEMSLPSTVTTEPVDVDGVPGCWVTASDANPNKVVLLMHGGGFVSGSIAAYQRLAADVSAFCGTRVLLIEYRLAPEHPYPAGLDDCVRAYSWLLESGIKPGHVALLGDSAGGGLVVSTAMRLKEDGVDQPSALVALSPWVNLKCDGETMDTKAKDDPITNRDSLTNIAALYLGEADAKDPLISPIYGDLRGLPPLLIQVGTREVLLDDSRKLAVRARADDVMVSLEEWPGMFHVWHMWTDSLTDASRALGGIGAFVRQQMG